MCSDLPLSPVSFFWRSFIPYKSTDFIVYIAWTDPREDSRDRYLDELQIDPKNGPVFEGKFRNAGSETSLSVKFKQEWQVDTAAEQLS